MIMSSLQVTSIYIKVGKKIKFLQQVTLLQDNRSSNTCLLYVYVYMPVMPYAPWY